MKIERRGKYPGVKLHLEPEECQVFLKLLEDQKKAGNQTQATKTPTYFDLSVKIGRKIFQLQEEDPTLFKERSEEEIHATLSKEFVESQEKLKALGLKEDWTKIKVEVKK